MPLKINEKPDLLTKALTILAKLILLALFVAALSLIIDFIRWIWWG